MKRAPGLAGRYRSKKGDLWSIRFKPLLPTCMVRPEKQSDRATRAQVRFDIGRTDVALTAVADDTAARRGRTAKYSGAVSKAERL